MAYYLTIPEIVDGEPMLSLSPSPDGVTFGVMIAFGDTAVRLMRANVNGEHIPLVVLTTDHQILALDSVYVTEVMTASQSDALITFVAQAVRFI
jgi:hypothetical protein